MASPSVSFRISRSAEDLAGTLHLLSQRLVQLEQRLALLEAREQQEPEQEDPALDQSLGNAERLLLDCRSLLEGALQEPAASSEAEPLAAEQAFEPDEEVEEPGMADDDQAVATADLQGEELDAIPLFLQQEVADEAAA